MAIVDKIRVVLYFQSSHRLLVRCVRYSFLFTLAAVLTDKVKVESNITNAFKLVNGDQLIDVGRWCKKLHQFAVLLFQMTLW